jgi:hypothetical protein
MSLLPWSSCLDGGGVGGNCGVACGCCCCCCCCTASAAVSCTSGFCHAITPGTAGTVLVMVGVMRRCATAGALATSAADCRPAAGSTTWPLQHRGASADGLAMRSEEGMVVPAYNGRTQSATHTKCV